MKIKIKKFTEMSGDMIGSLASNEFSDHIGRGGLDARADFIQPSSEVVEEDGSSGPPSAISTSGSTAALTANPSSVGGFDPNKKKDEKELEEAHYSYIDNVQVPGEVDSGPTGSILQTNTGTLEEENYGDLGANGDGGRISDMHDLNQQAFDNFNSDTSQNLQSYDTTDQTTGQPRLYSNQTNALTSVSDGEEPTLVSTSKELGGKSGFLGANSQTLINKDHYPTAQSPTLDDEAKLESLILSEFPHHDSRFMKVFENQYNSKYGKQKIQGKMYESSFVLKHGNYQEYFLEYLDYFKKDSSIVERYEDQNRVDKYSVINSNSEEISPRTLEEETMENFNLDDLDPKDENKLDSDIESEVEAGEGGELLDILKKIADGGLTPEEAIEDVKSAIEKEDDMPSGDEFPEEEPEEGDEEDEPLEESGNALLATEDVAQTHQQAMEESRAKAAKPAAKKPPVKPKAPTKKEPAKKPPFGKKDGKKTMKESGKPFAANFYYIYQNGKVVDFGQATKVTESQVTLANGKCYNLASVTLAPMRGW